MNYKYKAIITDVDGTLYSQTPLRIHMGLWMVLCEPMAIVEIMKFRRRREHGELIQPSERVKRWMYINPIKVIGRYAKHDICDLLAELREDGMRIIAYSDYPATEKLQALGIHVDAIYDPDNPLIEELKPDPQGLKALLADQNLDVGDCLYIGDRMEKDGLCAEAVGMDYLIVCK